MRRLSEKRAFKINGFMALAVFFAIVGGVIWSVVHRQRVPAGLLSLAGFLMLPGFFAQQPNRARVLTFFGRYVGSIVDDGFWWTNPLARRRMVSLRVENFHSAPAKVNDADGNPIEIGAVVVWRVTDTAKAAFDVESYEPFVGIQFETAVRGLATQFPYDDHGDGTPSLRDNPDVAAAALKREVAARVAIAGVSVIEARISHLAYAPEIAQAMLRRQQAQAIIAARRQIVDGAVGMVEHALERLENGGAVTLDNDRKAQMVNNLLVVLTSDQDTQPVVSTAS